MKSEREALLFVLTLSTAALLLVSIAAAETMMFIAGALWLAWRPRRLETPTYYFPLLAFMAATAISLAASPQPELGWGPVRKIALLPMGVLAATFINTRWRARASMAVLAAFSAVASVLALVQFGRAYLHYLSTNQLADDPMILARITGFMGHWMTFSGEQVLIWCAAIPALLALGRRWIVPIVADGAAIILSFTRSAWLGAAAGIAAVAVMLPRRLLVSVLAPLGLVALLSSGLIYHRIALSVTSPVSADNGAGEGVAARIKLWKAGIQMIHDHPLFGVGPQRIVVEFPKYYHGADLRTFYFGHLENNFIQIAAERGLLCFATFLWFLLELYAELFRMLKIAEFETRWTVISALAALTGFVVCGLAEFNFGDSEVFLLLLFIVSLPYGVIREPIPTG